MRAIPDFLRSSDGATAVEYAVMLALLLITVIAAVIGFGQSAGDWWGNIDTELQNNGF